jgi:hypothetical protein
MLASGQFKPSPAMASNTPIGPTPPMSSAMSAMPKAFMKKGGSVSSASSRGDGIAQRGKTKGRMV